jgi:hypothetical protein
MNKNSREGYIKEIAEAMNEVYGDTLTEYDTDIMMAEAVVDKLSDYLFFGPSGYGLSKKDFNKWKRERTNE